MAILNPLSFADTAINHWRFFSGNRALNKPELLTVAVYSTLAVIAEAGGLAMLLPIIGFVEHGRDVTAFAASTPLAAKIVQAYDYVGVTITIATLSIVAFLFILTRTIINYKFSVGVERIKWTIGKRLSVLYFNKILDSEASFIRTIKPGQFTVTADYECQATAALVRVYAYMWQQLISLVAYAGVLVYTAGAASVIALAMIGISMIFHRFLIVITKRLSMRGITYRRNHIDFLNERFRGWKLIKLAGSLVRETKNAEQLSSQATVNQVSMVRVGALLTLIFVPTMAALMLSMLYVFIEVLSLDVSTVVLFILILLRLTPITQAMQKQLSLLAQYTPSQSKLCEELKMATSYRETDVSANTIVCVDKEIKFKSVRFTYPERETPALDGIDLLIPAGKMTALIGRSGSGKSTMVDMIPRLIRPQEGQIFIDGQPITDISLAALRKAIALVPQESFLLDASVSDNIRYMMPDAPEEEVVVAAKMAYAHGFIMKLPDGYSTMLGESGGRLSGGQRQRIALARAFIRKAPILVLDEPTSALDSESEEAVKRAIEQVIATGKTTVIVIAHRMSTIENADLVALLSGGRIARSGPPASVIPHVSQTDFMD